MVYLDYAAATPLDPQVEAAMKPYWRQQFFNPSATYLAGQTVHKALQAARTGVASQLGAKPSEIIFTAGGTEADNLAIKGVMEQFPKSKLLVSAIEHAAVLEVAQKYQHELIPVTKKGRLDLAKLARQIDDQTVLISVMYANNEVGTVQPVKDVAKLVQQELKQRAQKGNQLPLYLHTDASQAANYIDLHVSRLGVDLMTINGGKIYGPKQTGALYVRAGLLVQPQVLGGGQERGLRSGTENVPGFIGLAKALEVAQTGRTEESQRLAELRDQLSRGLQQAIPDLEVNGGEPKLPNNLHITIPGTDNERIMMELDEQGIVCAVGSACSASHDEPSHVLRAIGLTEKQAQSSLRFSLGRQTTAKDIAAVVKTLPKIVAAQ